MKNVAEIVVLQPAVAQAAAGSCCSRRNIIVYPEGEVGAKTSGRNDCKGVRDKQIRARYIAPVRDYRSGVWPVGDKIPLIPEGDWYRSWDFPWVESLWKGFLLGLRPKQHGFLFHKS